MPPFGCIFKFFRSWSKNLFIENCSANARRHLIIISLAAVTLEGQNRITVIVNPSRRAKPSRIKQRWCVVQVGEWFVNFVDDRNRNGAIP